MTADGTVHVLRGRCHCERLLVEFTTASDLASFQPRACDCSFCSKHGAMWISDPDGRLVFVERQAGTLREYRQGSESARFLLCSQCGVCVGVVHEEGSQRVGAVNAGCLDDRANLRKPLPASPRLLDAQEKVARWKAMWVPDVVVEMAEP